jgi:hypothetical protein
MAADGNTLQVLLTARGDVPAQTGQHADQCEMPPIRQASIGCGSVAGPPTSMT